MKKIKNFDAYFNNSIKEEEVEDVKETPQVDESSCDSDDEIDESSCDSDEEIDESSYSDEKEEEVKEAEVTLDITKMPLGEAMISLDTYDPASADQLAKFCKKNKIKMDIMGISPNNAPGQKEVKIVEFTGDYKKLTEMINVFWDAATADKKQ